MRLDVTDICPVALWTRGWSPRASNQQQRTVEWSHGVKTSPPSERPPVAYDHVSAAKALATRSVEEAITLMARSTCSRAGASAPLACITAAKECRTATSQ